MAKDKIGVLIAEDSEGLLQLLVRTFERDSRLEVRGVARNGEEAVEKALMLKPDVISMDLNMPKMDGVEAIRQIMATCPTPIVVVTAISESEKSFEAIRAGALEVVAKPQSINTPEGAKGLAFIVETLKIMADVRVLTRKPIANTPPPSGGPLITNTPSKSFKTPPNLSAGSPPLISTTPSALFKNPPLAPAAGPLITNTPSASFKTPPINQFRENPVTPRIVAIASSTGGPPALNQVLKKISKEFPVPILIVQHITVGFGQGLVEWLNTTLQIKVVEATDGDTPMPHHIYIAPDNFHLMVDAGGKMRLSRGLPIKGHRPSANLLFESVGQHYGPTALGIILTGMGDDGTEGLKVFKKERGYCIAQDEASCVVFGMPKAAIDAGLADQIMNLEEIGNYLQKLANKAGR
jgi:two-component system chemotaxis response regulator CheB